MTTIQKFIKDNYELLKIASYSIAAVIAVVAVVGILIFVYTRVTDSSVYYDNIAKRNVDSTNTGGGLLSGPSYIGINDISTKLGLNADILGRAKNNMDVFFSASYPQVKTLSLDVEKMQHDDNVYNFEFEADTGVRFFMEIEYASGSEYRLSISEKNGKLLDYNSTAVSSVTYPAAILGDKLLPYTGTLASGLQYTLHEKSDKSLELAISSCGDENIKKQARDAITSWLKLQNYNPDEISYSMADYCDGAI